MFEKEIYSFPNKNYEDYPQFLKHKIERSWNKIFDLYFEADDISLPYKENKIQVTFWDLKLQDIIKVDKFTAK